MPRGIAADMRHAASAGHSTLRAVNRRHPFTLLETAPTRAPALGIPEGPLWGKIHQGQSVSPRLPRARPESVGPAPCAGQVLGSSANGFEPSVADERAVGVDEAMNNPRRHRFPDADVALLAQRLEPRP